MISMGKIPEIPLPPAETHFYPAPFSSLITQIVPHFEQRRELDWARAVYKRVEFASFLDQTASSVDSLLARFSVCENSQLPMSTD